MTDIQVIRADVKKSAAAVEAAADHVGGIDITGPLSAFAKAAPGGISAGAAKTAGSKLGHERDTWVKQARAHHKMTTADAEHIQQTDEAVASAGHAQASHLSDGARSRMSARLGGAQ